ncbi:5-hydroxytryptamine receptor 2C-like [Mercenaria mercenaria]|uniref:5-hydroxytryptamine receptor 2C-like n=1 Tax=Mercenaria mercenaria TaxID=6596 RepID=UPI001E1D8FD9|nr:5-hydroxytryptamine receptor 2C-like [Mercenaria mercenaria]
MSVSNYTWSSDFIYQHYLSDENYSTKMPLNSSYMGNNLPDTYNWGVLFLVPIVLFGITGNILVCMAVSMEKRLQTVTNYFLFSLAVTDLHVCIIVMPMSIMNDFFGYWRFSHVLCSVYTTSDVLMCTSSILHLCSISLERYLAIRNPLKSRNKSKSIVLLKISLIWAAAAAISSPVTVLGVLDESNIFNNRQCTLTNNEFIIYGSILAFFIPLIIMVVSYGLTIRLLHKQSKLYDPNGNVAQSGQPILRRVKSRRHKNRANSSPTPSRQSFSGTRGHNMYEMCIKSKSQMNIAECGRSLRIPSIISQSASCETIYTTSKENSQANRCFLSVPNHHTNCTSSESLISDNETTSDDESRSYIHVNGTESPGKRSLRDVMTKQIIVKASSILNLTRDKNSDKTTVRTEQKASKVLGFVFAIFVMCWTPFFVVNILTVLCKVCSFNPILLSTFVWLGWISSTINPIIYTMFNCTFKQTFVKLIKCQYGFLQKPGKRRMEGFHKGAVEYNMNIPL